MQVKVLYEAGLNEALKGMAYSFRDEGMPPEEFWTDERFKRSLERAHKLAWMQGGHNKFLESVVVCVEVKASRAWWCEMDTYRVGTTKQSTSTMHTLAKRAPTAEDFHPATPFCVISAFIDAWYLFKGDVQSLKMALPEGFLQTRIITTNYKVLQNVAAQRRGHRLKQWDEFIDQLKEQVKFPEWIENESKIHIPALS